MDCSIGEIFEMVDKRTMRTTRVSRMYGPFKIIATQSAGVAVDVYIQEMKNRNFIHLPLEAFERIRADDEFMASCKKLQVDILY